MKKIDPVQQKKIKQSNANKKLNDMSFIKMSKSEIFTQKKHKKSTSSDKQIKEMSKNDPRIPIYTDKQGFIVQYSILNYGLKCECSISENSGKKSVKPSNSVSTINLSRQNSITSIKKSIKLLITLNKSLIAVIKNGVEHIFNLPQERKHNFLKIVLIQNWQLQQFIIVNKKIKICDGQILSATQKGYDQIYPLKKIDEADQLRKNKLIKSDSKIRIAWNNTASQKEDNSQNQNSNKSDLNFNFMTRSLVMKDSINEYVPQNAFLRKSFTKNDQDQTRDSQQQQTILNDKKQSIKSEIKIEHKSSKNISINLKSWHQNKNFDISYTEKDELPTNKFQIYTPKQRHNLNNFCFPCTPRGRK